MQGEAENDQEDRPMSLIDIVFTQEQQEKVDEDIDLLRGRAFLLCGMMLSAPPECVRRTLLFDNFTAELSKYLQGLKPQLEKFSYVKDPTIMPQWYSKLKSLPKVYSVPLLQRTILDCYEAFLTSQLPVSELLRHAIVISFSTARAKVLCMSLSHKPCPFCYRWYGIWTRDYIAESTDGNSVD